MGNRDPDQLVASIEEDPIAQSLDSRTTFIPLRHSDLVLDLLERFQIRGEDANQFMAACSRLQRIFHAEHLTQLLHLEEIYGPLDPDSQVVEVKPLGADDFDNRVDRLFDRVSGLLFSAHYKRLDREDIERAMEMASQWGVRLNVNFDLYDRIEIFARGYHVVNIKRRRWQRFFREESIELPEFERLIMAFRLKPEHGVIKGPRQNGSVESKPNRRKQLSEKISRLLAGDDEDALDSSHVYLKTFKNIPETDLEILLPGSKVKLTLVDRGKILLPTAMALYKATRLAIVPFIAALLASRFDKVLPFLILLGAIIGYLAKSILSYFRTREKYQFGLTKSLYLKNLGNNSGVLYRILNEAEEQELLETILGYTILWQHKKRTQGEIDESVGLTSAEMDQRVEEYLSELTEVDIDFEVFDSLGKLARLGLAHVDKDGCWSAIPIEQTGKCLDDCWTKLFSVRAMRVELDSENDDGLFVE